MEKCKQGDMMTENKMSSWYVLHTAPKSECKLMQRLNAAGYIVFCPMQIVFKNWNGQTREVIAPLFPGCLFVEETATLASFIASQDIAYLIDSDGRNLSICSDKAELSAEFARLLK